MSIIKLYALRAVRIHRRGARLFTVLATLATVLPALAADAQGQAERSLGQQYLSVLPALFVILLLIIGLAFLIKKFNPTFARVNPLMQVLGTLPLGGKERLVLVQAGDAYLLLGVTPGQIQTLHLVNPDSLHGVLNDTPPGLPAAGFAGILQAVIKR